MKKDPDATYTIKCTHKQLRVLEEALDLHTRLCLGQLWIVAEFLDNRFYRESNEKNHWYYRQKYCDQWAKEMFGFTAGSSYGVGSPKVPEEGLMAYEMCKLMQNAISKSEEHEGYSVWKNPPLRYTKEPFIEVKQNEHGEKWGPVLGFAEKPVCGDPIEPSQRHAGKTPRATKRVRSDCGSNRGKERNGKQKPAAN